MWKHIIFSSSEPACQEVTKLVEEEVEEEVCNTIEEEVLHFFFVVSGIN